MPRHRYNTRYKTELTPRQSEVLDLIARGKTNTEIGLALGISLDGAKYHVSEVLAKIDVATREDAASWWREQNRPLVRFKARIAGLPLRPIFLATGFGGGLACAAAAVALFFPGLADDGRASMPPCPAAAVRLNAGTSLGDKSSSASVSANYAVTTRTPCAIDDRVTITVLDRSGVPLPVDGNGLEVQLHNEVRPVAFVIDGDREPVLVTPGAAAPPDAIYGVTVSGQGLFGLWVNWCESYGGPVTVVLRSERYPAGVPSYISNPPRCLDPSQPSTLRLASRGR